MKFNMCHYFGGSQEEPLRLPQSPTPQRSNKLVGAKKVKVTTKAIKMKDGPGFKVSLVVPLKQKNKVLGEQITVGQLIELHQP